MVDKEWEWKGSLPQSLKEFQTKLEAWNHDTFGNIFRRKTCNELQLFGVQRALERWSTKGLLKLDMKLREERRVILLQEELIWLQK